MHALIVSNAFLEAKTICVWPLWAPDWQLPKDHGAHFGCRASGGKPDEEDGGVEDAWFGSVRLIFTLHTRTGAQRSCLFVRWYDIADFNDSDSHLERSMRKLHWAETRKRGSRGACPWYDVVDIDRVIKPVFIQPHPTQRNHFFYNRFV